jgi:hypothetical protein
MLDFDGKLSVPQHTLFRELAGEAVLLNLASGTYFGLDAPTSASTRPAPPSGRP